MTSRTLSLFFILTFSMISFSQNEKPLYEPNKKNAFGKYNPKAPKQVQDYASLIGKSKCKSERRNPDRSWAKPVNMIWTWKYIMNGTAVQDMTFKEDGSHGGSLRQYNIDSLKWYVHYYATKVASPKLGTWSGNKTKDGSIVLYKDQKAPNGIEGFSRLTFYDISNKGYKWKGEWVDKSETVVFPFWKIECTKEE